MSKLWSSLHFYFRRKIVSRSTLRLSFFTGLPKAIAEHFHLMPGEIGVRNGEDNSMIDFVSIHQVSGERKGGRKEGEND